MEYLYAALLLHKAGKEINEENLKKVIQAAGIETDENRVKILIATLKGVDIDKELESAVLVAAPATSSGTEKHEKPAEKKEEKASEAAEGLSALFG